MAYYITYHFEDTQYYAIKDDKRTSPGGCSGWSGTGGGASQYPWRTVESLDVFLVPLRELLIPINALRVSISLDPLTREAGERERDVCCTAVLLSCLFAIASVTKCDLCTT